MQTQSLADMHLSSLQREQETRFRSNMRNSSKADFAPMQREGFQNSKWAGFIKPTGYKPMIILFWLFLIQQFSGIYITLFFAVTFFQVRGDAFYTLLYSQTYSQNINRTKIIAFQFAGSWIRY